MSTCEAQFAKSITTNTDTTSAQLGNTASGCSVTPPSSRNTKDAAPVPMSVDGRDSHDHVESQVGRVLPVATCADGPALGRPDPLDHDGDRHEDEHRRPHEHGALSDHRVPRATGRRGQGAPALDSEGGRNRNDRPAANRAPAHRAHPHRAPRPHQYPYPPPPVIVVGVVVGGGDVVGVVVGGGGEVDCVAGICETGGLVGVATCEPCAVEVGGWVLVVGAEVDVDGAPACAAAVAGIPLFSTANHEPAIACPFACPFFVSPSKR